MVSAMYLTWLLPLLVMEATGQSTLCSSSNTANSEPQSNIYESRSACSDECKDQSAYAVVQYDKCWCTDTAPDSTTDNGDCSKPCPGYPLEMCGGEGFYTYLLLERGRVIPGSSSSSSSSSKQSPPIITVTQTKDGESATTVKTVQASISVATPTTFRTVTVTGAPTVSTIAVSNVNSATEAPKKPNELKQGVIAGIAVGGSAAGICMGLAAFMIWRRNKYNKTDDAGNARDGQYRSSRDVIYFGPRSTTIKRDNTSALADSRMGAFGQNKTLWRTSTGSLEDSSSESNHVLRVVNPDMPEKL